MRTHFIIFLALLLAFSPAMARTTKQQPKTDFLYGIALGYTSLDFPAKLDSKPVFPSYVASASWSFEKSFLSVSYADAFEDVVLSEEEDTGTAGRSDLDVTWGFRSQTGWNAFLGYKDSETALNFRLRDSDISRAESYEKNGYYAGLSYTADLKTSGNLTFTFAYSDLKTENLFRGDVECDPEDLECVVDEPEVEEFDDLTGVHKGEAKGWSYGVNWLIPVSKTLAFNSTIKINNYEERIDVLDERYKADQSITFFNVGIIFVLQ